MNITLDGREYPVKIKHLRLDKFTANHSAYQRILKNPEGIVRFAEKDVDAYTNPKGGVTEAYVIIRPDITIAGRAICSIKDNFNKKIGTKIATERLMSLINRIK